MKPPIAMWVLAFLLANPACTLFVDHSAAQCQTDQDCVKFHFHPFCQTRALKPCQGDDDCVCVDSKLKPKDCVFGFSTPAKRTDFLNQCSRGALPGDDTTPLGECLTYVRPPATDAGTEDPAPLIPPPQADAGAPVPKVLCRDTAPPGGSVLYLSGSSNFPPLLERVAPAISKSLAELGFPPVTPVFKTTTSCAGVQSIYPEQGKTPATSAHVIHDLTSATDTYPQYFDPVVGKLASCSLGPAGQEVDVGESEIFPETCGMIRDDVDVLETPGPNLAILFVAPKLTDQKVISAEAARQVFSVGGLEPWTMQSFLYIRGAGTATQQLIGRAIGVPSNSFRGIDQGTAPALALNLGNVTMPSTARRSIGILGADFYDRSTITLKALGFQASDQDCAYTPDTNSNNPVVPKDKINVRDGHYPIWGPVHLFTARVGSQSSPSATSFMNLFGTPQLPEEMLNAFIDASFVPKCAMMVQRDTELGPLSSAVPAVSCGCHFDARVSGSPKPPGCTSCASNLDCVNVPNKPECLYGFCEIAFGQ